MPLAEAFGLTHMGPKGGLNAVLPVDYYIPGCPPRPEAILYGVAVAMKLVDPKVQPYEYEEPLEVRSASGETVFAAGGSRSGA